MIQNWVFKSNDIDDTFPDLTAVLFDGKIIVDDNVNKKIVVYSGDGTVFKVLPKYINKESKILNPDYSFYKYWDVQGYTTEGNIWYQIDSYFLKSPTGQLIKHQQQSRRSWE